MQGKRILLGITGGIAAYKIASLIRLLIKSGAEVKCILTPASSDFISPLTVATLSKNPAYIDFWDEKTGVWTNHVELGMWADLFVIAPLTANSLAKMATGLADNLLLTAYLSAKCKVMVAPAMDLDMYAHPTTKRNLETLEKDGVIVLPSNSGELASGLIGEGRMAEPEEILQAISSQLDSQQDFLKKKIIITAGPTYEALDPVRFIGNHSSGQMGIAIADELASRGAEVVLILGPSKHLPANAKVSVTSVTTATQMLSEVQKHWTNCDSGIFSAAVADYRPAEVATQKIKKSSDDLTITLTKNPDILLWAGENKKPHQVLVGFALETENEEVNAQGKLKKKNLDFIVLNSLQDPGAGFAHSTNKIAIFDKHNNSEYFELKSKRLVAGDIVNKLKTTFK
ncbi:MAG: phosphopantothenoylcysteine decarboxylase/phosphopantothenate--cysteine ligase [Lentimonas sp.]|jgi:phosphopantothenoylcysteine decarboxylase/phosphopantothenate--cysteine ligase